MGAMCKDKTRAFIIHWYMAKIMWRTDKRLLDDEAKTRRGEDVRIIQTRIISHIFRWAFLTGISAIIIFLLEWSDEIHPVHGAYKCQ